MLCKEVQKNDPRPSYYIANVFPMLSLFAWYGEKKKLSQCYNFHYKQKKIWMIWEHNWKTFSDKNTRIFLWIINWIID